MSEQTLPTTYDSLIIGAGPAGYACALELAQFGQRVALIERDTIGGVCLNRGCIPSKALLSIAHTLDSMQRAARFGMQPSYDLPDAEHVRAHRDGSVEHMRSGLQALLAQRGVDVWHALAQVQAVQQHASQTGEGPSEQPTEQPTVQASYQVRLSAADSGDITLQHGREHLSASESVTLQASHIILALGSKPRLLNGMKLSERILDSTGALALNTFPKRAIIIGAGAIAAEFASIWRAAGTEVNLMIRKDRLLSSWDKRAGVALTRGLQARGVQVIANSSVLEVQEEGNQVRVTYQAGKAKDEATPQSVSADVVLCAIGRQASSDQPWISQLGIAVDEQGYIRTDEFGATNIANVWAIGDITGGKMLAHRAFEQAVALAKRITGQPVEPVQDRYCPDVVFSMPEAARVGYDLQMAQQDETLRDVRAVSFPMKANARMMSEDESGMFQVVVGKLAEAQEDLVLGMSMVGPIASELISMARFIVGTQMSLSQASQHILAHPTFSEIVSETLHKANNTPLHLP